MINTLAIVLDGEKKYIDFSLVFKKLKDKYDSLELLINSTGNILEFEAKFYASDLHEVEYGEISFFNLQKG